MNDDDLFDDAVSLEDLDNEYVPPSTNNSESSEYVTSPKFQKLFEELKKELSNVDSFSFVLFSRTYSVILDHIQNGFSDLFDPRTFREVVNHKIQMGPQFSYGLGAAQYPLIVKLNEYERCIVGTNYFLEIIGHMTAHLKDNNKCADNDSYVSYVYRHVVREYAFTSLYLAHLIDNYVELCISNNLTPRSPIVDDKIFPYLSVVERQIYGEQVHALEIENIGEVIDAVGSRDDYTSKTGTYISQFVSSMQEVLDKIKQGDTSGLELEFRQ